ncbi:hypothetical protein Poly51_02700 [Rubripirellula tenax]|uniref:3-keto-disaccharide hydrolase domain-containing protein n=1 Tax=Rubripirellula tenax TaxID=2528015 RepID=A0A5C6FIT5_9BACT|nr:hypothetical protein [Rubripirellula tenax]TWU59997.1 hypothetical protein Poly51_02700 [Rubripirellula tenax]
MNRFATCVVFSFLLFSLPLATGDDPVSAPVAEADMPGKTVEKPDSAPKFDWRPMTGKWVSSQFGGDGSLEIKPDAKSGDSVKLGVGDPLSGVRWEGDAPKESFEIEVEARRTDGFDFFCGLTFPVGEKNVTYVLGGWGGGVVGISSIDGLDASENSQTYYQTFENGTWYKVRARVDPYQIQTWVDDKLSIEQPREGHSFGLRYEMEVCMPIGIAAYMCDVEYRKPRIRSLTETELAEAKLAAEKRKAEDE